MQNHEKETYLECASLQIVHLIMQSTLKDSPKIGSNMKGALAAGNILTADIDDYVLEYSTFLKYGDDVKSLILRNMIQSVVENANHIANNLHQAKTPAQ